MALPTHIGSEFSNFNKIEMKISYLIEICGYWHGSNIVETKSICGVPEILQVK